MLVSFTEVRKHWRLKLLSGSILSFSLSGLICHFSGYWLATVFSLIPAICLLSLWLGILIGLSGKHSREDFGLKKAIVKSTEVN